jgi:hypothetical protein
MTAVPRRNAVVDAVRELTPPREETLAGEGRPTFRYLSARFLGGDSGPRPEHPRAAIWASVLHSLRESRLPAYVEIDP